MASTAAPINISIVGTGTSEGGGVAPTPHGTIVKTPGKERDLRVNVISPFIALAVRFGNQFLTTFIGLLTAAGLGVNVLPAQTMQDLFLQSGYAAVIIAGIGLGKNLITIFTRIEGKYPLASGSI